MLPNTDIVDMSSYACCLFHIYKIIPKLIKILFHLDLIEKKYACMF